jgi:hypothetical protein
LTLSYKEYEIATDIIFFNEIFSNFAVFKFKAIKCFLNILLAQFLKRLGIFQSVSCFVSQNNNRKTFSKSIFNILSTQSHQFSLFNNFYSKLSQTSFCQSSIFLKRLPFTNIPFELISFILPELPRLQYIHGSRQLPLFTNLTVFLKPLIYCYRG